MAENSHKRVGLVMIESGRAHGNEPVCTSSDPRLPEDYQSIRELWKKAPGAIVTVSGISFRVEAKTTEAEVRYTVRPEGDWLCKSNPARHPMGFHQAVEELRCTECSFVIPLVDGKEPEVGELKQAPTIEFKPVPTIKEMLAAEETEENKKLYWVAIIDKLGSPYLHMVEIRGQEPVSNLVANLNLTRKPCVTHVGHGRPMPVKVSARKIKAGRKIIFCPVGKTRLLNSDPDSIGWDDVKDCARIEVTLPHDTSKRMTIRYVVKENEVALTN